MENAACKVERLVGERQRSVGTSGENVDLIQRQSTLLQRTHNHVPAT